MTTIRLQVVTFSGGQSANKHVNCISSEPKLFRAPWSLTWLPRNAGPQVWNVLLTQNIKSFAHRVLWLCPCLDLKTFRELHFPRPAGQSGQAAMLRNLFHIWPATGERGEWSRSRYLDIYAQHWPDMEPEIQTFGYCICIDICVVCNSVRLIYLCIAELIKNGIILILLRGPLVVLWSAWPGTRQPEESW